VYLIALEMILTSIFIEIVAIDPCFVRHTSVVAEFQTDFLVGSLRLEHVDEFFDEYGQICRAAEQAHASFFDFTQVKKLVYE